MQLIDILAVRYRRLQQTDQKERDELYGITHGNPLLIHWIAGQLGRPGSRCRTIAECCDFIAKAPEGNNPLEYIFGDLLDTFTEHETKILAALTHFTLPATVKWLVQMTGLSERVAETALEDLTDRAILFSDPEAHTYIRPPLAAEFIRTRRPDAVAKTGDTLVDTVYALAVQYGGRDNYDGFRILDSEWNLIAAALPRLLTGDNSRLQTVCGKLDRFLNFSGRWDDLLWLCERAETCAITADDKENAGWRAYHAGMINYYRNKPADLLACAARVSEHFKTSTSYNKTEGTRLRGIGHQLNGDYPTAITVFREVLELYRSISPESENVAAVLNDIADAERLTGDYSSAKCDLREALRIAKKVNNQESVAIYNCNLAGLALDRKQWDEAETLAREALILAQKVGRQDLIALNCGFLAKALLNQNRILSETVSFANRAVEIYTRLKSPDLQWARDTLEQLERALAE